MYMTNTWWKFQTIRERLLNLLMENKLGFGLLNEVIIIVTYRVIIRIEFIAIENDTTIHCLHLRGLTISCKDLPVSLLQYSFRCNTHKPVHGTDILQTNGLVKSFFAEVACILRSCNGCSRTDMLLDVPT